LALVASGNASSRASGLPLTPSGTSGRAIRLSQVLRGLPVALRPRADDDALQDVYLCHHRITTIDLRVAC
jgi:hypothetical protein